MTNGDILFDGDPYADPDENHYGGRSHEVHAELGGRDGPSNPGRGHVEMARSAAKDKRKARRKLPDGGLKDMLTYKEDMA